MLVDNLLINRLDLIILWILLKPIVEQGTPNLVASKNLSLLIHDQDALLKTVEDYVHVTFSFLLFGVLLGSHHARQTH